MREQSRTIIRRLDEIQILSIRVQVSDHALCARLDPTGKFHLVYDCPDDAKMTTICRET
jgi:hypothetical protein